ncbi:MAG: DUF2063 domain-containing protein [Rhizobiales bacterium]|nr:DUF2063 domain-containing protein [Hyphomicrobiales bacterium]
MLKGIMHPGHNIDPLIKNPARDTKDVMLGVYRYAYVSRLREFLANDHEKLSCYMGEAAFATMSKAYVAKYPSDQPNARWYSRHLPEFLAATPPFKKSPELAELALLERALNDAFDAPEAAHKTFDDLAAVPPEDIAQAQFAIHPSARCITVVTNVTGLWSSLRCGEQPPSPYRLDEPQEVLIWRQGSSSRFRLLGKEESMTLAKAQEGLPFGVICEMIAMMDDPDTAAIRAATYLRGWIEAELISDIRLA